MKRTINLLSPERRVARLVFPRLLALETGVLLFVLSLIGGVLWQQTDFLEKTVSQLEQRQRTLEPVRQQQQELSRLRQDNLRKQQLYADWLRQDMPKNELLGAIAGVMPPGAWLTELQQMEKDKNVILKGGSLTMDEISRLTEQLSTLPGYEGVEIKDVSRDKKQMLQFEILLKYKG